MSQTKGNGVARISYRCASEQKQILHPHPHTKSEILPEGGHDSDISVLKAMAH